MLLRLPTPLPGAATPAELAPLLARALRLLECPRGREADAGAQLTLLLLRKYGGGWGAGAARGCCWLLDLSVGSVEAPEPIAPGGQQQQPAGQQQQAEQQQAAALWCFLSSGCDLLEQRIAAARADMLDACRSGLALGVMLALR